MRLSPFSLRGKERNIVSIVREIKLVTIDENSHLSDMIHKPGATVYFAIYINVDWTHGRSLRRVIITDLSGWYLCVPSDQDYLSLRLATPDEWNDDMIPSLNIHDRMKLTDAVEDFLTIQPKA